MSDWKSYCSMDVLSSPLVFGIFSFMYGLIMGGWVSVWGLLFGLIVNEIVMVVVFKRCWRLHLSGGIYYILGWLTSRALFQPTRRHVFSTTTQPWRATKPFKHFMDVKLQRVQEQIDVARSVQEKENLERRRAVIQDCLIP